jgi:hypothetical protein
VAQDQQVGARTKAMGGSYTAFEDDPVSIWLNPAGIATQPDGFVIAYQSYTIYEPKIDPNLPPSAPAEFGWTDPAVVPSFFGVVFQLGDSENSHSLGLGFMTPFRLKFVYDNGLDAQLDQTFYRSRVVYARDFDFRPRNEPGWFKHLSAGVGVDLSVTSWKYQEFAEPIVVLPATPPQNLSFNDAGLGGGAGLLLGLYDDLKTFKINFGIAIQSKANYSFSVSQDLVPIFDWPLQVNLGVTYYLMPDFPLRITMDLQWIDWGGACARPATQGAERFHDVVNLSVGVEYRIPVAEHIRLYPRLGFRYYDAPWKDTDDLPQVGTAKLIITPDAEQFFIVSGGLGVAWSSEGANLKTVDIAFDFGGDSGGFALSFGLEF